MEKSELLEKAKPNPGGFFDCLECGSLIMSAVVAHPIWDGPFPGSGSGKCEYEDVPYCPVCEEEPSFHGTPIKRGLGLLV